ncbi:SMI1/KNR4 family protein [Methylorubrum salsuginis]|uniref:SMI1 / KNR4 family (SUKH-1) n=1 Tax=Methylorubrum salsuginis TaxID=414703 RepID=A0A1I4E4Y0_9HYPH|nr:SMI1/KNR4 family protein [Methylorubrum salsuginis]SFL00812.1 SMI1 / KNR4 family (SUKH-1) [Methylorubrum salsuginis]
MWDSVFPGLAPGLQSSEADLARAESELGFSLPGSYRSFARECGAGRIGGHVRLFTPVPVEAGDLVARAHLIAHGIALAIDGLKGEGDEPHRFTVEGDADADLMDRACFFGETARGDFLFFDVTPGFPEYDIWVLSADLETVHFGGADLPAFVRGLQGLEVLHILGEGAGPLPATFEGDDADALERLGTTDA